MLLIIQYNAIRYVVTFPSSAFDKITNNLAILEIGDILNNIGTWH